MAIDKAIDSGKLNGAMTSTADAIRAKTGDSASIPWDEDKGFADAVTAITVKPADVSEKDVNFYDYDGTLLHAWTLAETAGKTELPELPSHDGLVCQGWNWTLAEIKALGREVNVGANYITDDGKTRLYIRVSDELASTVSLVFGQQVDHGVTVDWGDGSEPTTYSSSNNMVRQSHQYAVGDYVITLDPADGCGMFLGRNGSGENVLGTISLERRAYSNMLQKVEIGHNMTSAGIGSFTFNQCGQLKTITLPTNIIAIRNNAFEGCSSLKACIVPRYTGMQILDAAFYACVNMHILSAPATTVTFGNQFLRLCRTLKPITIPDSITSFGIYAFTNNENADRIIIPDTVTSIGTSFADTCTTMTELVIGSGITAIPAGFAATCYALTRLTFPAGITSIAANAFANCRGVELYDFTACTAVPTLAAAPAFTNIKSTCQIKVPAALADEWKAATNWATYADKIVGV
nr:MAG TPA: leucine-rich repeat protein [Caudoviricetes sp.]